MNKDERIEQKRKELAELLDGVPEIQRKIVDDLTQQAGFLAVTLEDLAKKINQDGTVEEYTNGENQKGRKMSSDAKLYATLISRYSAIITKLLKLAPSEHIRNRETPEERLEAYREQREKEKALDQEAAAAFQDAFDAGEVDAWHFSQFKEQYKAEHGEK